MHILKSQLKETYYTGVSADPHRRRFFHNHGNKGYTRRYRPWDLVFTRGFETKGQALAAERIVKGWKSRKMFRFLVDGTIDVADYLKE